MKLMKLFGNTVFLIIVMVFTLNQNVSQAQEDGDDIIIGKYRTLYSSILGEERTLLVHLPDGYEGSNDQYPVLYLLDGERIPSFTRSVGTVAVLGWEGMPKTIVVGIKNTDRNRDMFPVKVNRRPSSGGAENFLRFLTEEVFTFVNNHYRAGDYRMLYGASNAGLFTVYALMEKPESFDAYIAASPMIGWCDDVINEKTRERFQNNQSLRKFLFMNYGKTDSDRVTQFIGQYNTLIQNHAPEYFQWSLLYAEDEGHVPYTSLRDGLIALLKSGLIKRNN